MSLTAGQRRRLDLVHGHLAARDADVILDIGLTLIGGTPTEGDRPPPLRVQREALRRIAAREPRSPFEAFVIAWANRALEGTTDG